ncbi:MAG: NUDIX hydrolase [Oscillospiraceae bacterium]|jgi:8-oxo-dGTP diphosphatase|nr:NUDIX hydrolase [Oscillospiraceae bacterium]
MNTRAFAGAFLRWRDEVILMKRGMHKIIAPGLWAGIGGRIEPFEHGDPLRACLREIEEETGIKAPAIACMDLRYYALCKTRDTLDTIYYFVGELSGRHPLTKTEEGTLHWINMQAALAYPMSAHTKAFYHHWVHNPAFENIYCCLEGCDGEITLKEIK